ncbi:hypothetical protein DFAR_630048 [Desulfarculales bacterium]
MGSPTRAHRCSGQSLLQVPTPGLHVDKTVGAAANFAAASLHHREVDAGAIVLGQQALAIYCSERPPMTACKRASVASLKLI